MSAGTARKLKFIGCEVLYREACKLTAQCPHRVDLQFLRKGLHDLQTPDMLAKLQAAVDQADADGYDAILLGYARCNDGTVGLAARGTPLVIPRAHDCITLFFGSRRAFKEYFDAHPGTYYMTSGWAERDGDGEGQRARPAYGQLGVMGKLGLTDTYEQLVAKFGREQADYIRQALGDWRRNYSRLLYLRMGVCDETPFIAQARGKCERNGWEFDCRDGDWTLLRKLFWGDWDEDFVVVAPGAKLIARNDERILDAGR